MPWSLSSFLQPSTVSPSASSLEPRASSLEPFTCPRSPLSPSLFPLTLSKSACTYIHYPTLPFTPQSTISTYFFIHRLTYGVVQLLLHVDRACVRRNTANKNMIYPLPSLQNALTFRSIGSLLLASSFETLLRRYVR